MKFKLNLIFRGYRFLFFAFILLSDPVIGQVSDQGLKEMADSLYIRALDYFDRGVADSAVRFADSLLVYSQVNNLPSYEGKAYYALGLIAVREGENQRVVPLYLKADSILQLIHDTLQLAKVNLRLSMYYQSLNDNENNLKYKLKAYDYFKTTNDTFMNGVINDHLALFYLRQGNYFKALKHTQDAIHYFSQMNKTVIVGKEYNSLGLIYRNTNNKEKEKQAYLDGIALMEQGPTSLYLGEAYSNLSELYLEENQVDLGFETLEKARNIFVQMNNPIGLSSCYAVESHYYFTRPDPDYKRVVELSRKSADLSFENGDYRSYADACSYIGSAYRHLGEFQKAEKVMLGALKYAGEYGFKAEAVKLTGELSLLYETMNNYTQAFVMLKKHNQLMEELKSAEKLQEFTNLDLNYLFRQEQIKDSLIHAQKEQQLIHQHENEIHAEQRSQLILLFLLVIFVLTSLFIYFYSRKRKAQIKLLDEKNAQINESLKEKELLLREIHHRVKNNFQTVSSLLELQSMGIDNEKALQKIEEGQTRIQSMALIHQRLYQNNDLSKVEFQEYIEKLAGQIALSHSNKQIDLSIRAHDITLDIDTAIPLGLILNELITNACKYAFSDDRHNTLEIEMKKQEDSQYVLKVKDSGPGLPDDFKWEQSNSLGLRLVKRLTRQLQGKVEYSSDQGSIFVIYFKDSMARAASD